MTALVPLQNFLSKLNLSPVLLTFLFLCFLLPLNSNAGIVEVSATYNYKRTNYDQNQYSAGESGTGGIGYYFWETSAFEITYTRGAEILVQSSGTTYQDLTAYGADFLFTVANQGSPFKPYLKLGAVYIIKNLRAFYSNGTVSSPIVDQGTAAQVGLGFKWMLGPRFGIKSGIDVSTSPLNNSSHTTYDFAANIGASFLF